MESNIEVVQKLKKKKTINATATKKEATKTTTGNVGNSDVPAEKS